MRPNVTSGLVLLFLSICAGCQSFRYAEKGAAVGAVTGAVAGAALGEDGGDAAAGAAIGSAVGLLAGAAVGDAIDQDMARNQALIEQRMGRRMAGAATMNDVISMTQAGLSEDIIRTHIESQGVARPLQVGDLIALRNAGVSDGVIQAMQRTPVPRQSDPSPTPNPRPVFVEEHHYFGPPCPPYGPYGRHRFHRYWHAPRRQGVSWGVTIGN